MKTLSQQFGLLEGDLDFEVDLVSHPITVTRHLPSEIEDGMVQSDVVEEFEAMASVQPLNQRELRRLPEGFTNGGRVKLYTKTRLFTVEISKAKMPDEFEYHGVRYQIDREDDWLDEGNYYKYEAERMDR